MPKPTLNRSDLAEAVEIVRGTTQTKPRLRHLKAAMERALELEQALRKGAFSARVLAVLKAGAAGEHASLTPAECVKILTLAEGARPPLGLLQ